MKSNIIIKDLSGKSRYSVNPNEETGVLPHWTNIFQELCDSPPIGLKNLNLRNFIKEPVSASSIDFSGTDFSMDSMERSSFIECVFNGSKFKPTNFHHHADKTDNISRSMGTLFIDCSFDNCIFQNCDFVMSKFIRCSFNGAKFYSCDLRNVTWFDRHDYPQALRWESIPDLVDPFKNALLKNCKFGHPMANIMSVPVYMMIPKSYESVWSQLGEINKKIIIFSYIMQESPDKVFQSAV